MTCKSLFPQHHTSFDAVSTHVVKLLLVISVAEGISVSSLKFPPDPTVAQAVVPAAITTHTSFPDTESARKGAESDGEAVGGVAGVQPGFKLVGEHAHHTLVELSIVAHCIVFDTANDMMRMYVLPTARAWRKGRVAPLETMTHSAVSSCMRKQV